jgi:hypothetical protein
VALTHIAPATKSSGRVCHAPLASQQRGLCRPSHPLHAVSTTASIIVIHGTMLLLRLHLVAAVLALMSHQEDALPRAPYIITEPPQEKVPCKLALSVWIRQT